MTTGIALLHAPEDKERATELASALEASGFAVQTEPPSPMGAKAVLMLWTPDALKAPSILEAAQVALSRGALVSVPMRKTLLPEPFCEAPKVDLTGWRGSPSNVFYRDLTATLSAMLADAPPPEHKGPATRLRNRILAGATVTGVCSFCLAFATNLFSMQTQLCSIPFAQPQLSDLCGMAGFGGKPTQAERLAWAAIEPGNCDQLRKHVQTFPTGAYRDDAADLISARRVERIEDWVPAVRKLALFVRLDGDPARSEDHARQAALARSQPAAKRLCKGFATTSVYRFVSAAPVAAAWDCEAVSGGTICGFEGEASCELELQQITEVEHCGG